MLKVQLSIVTFSEGIVPTIIPLNIQFSSVNEFKLLHGEEYFCQPNEITLLNTTFFMGTLVTLFASTMRESFGMGKVLPFIFAFVGVNGVVEAIVCFVVGTAISMALKKALRYS